MAVTPSRRASVSDRLLGARLPIRSHGKRQLARRRILVTLTKLVLPVVALVLLTVMAVWPELDRAGKDARLHLSQLSGIVRGATLVDARYHGMDERNRPYTVTASTATQVNPQRINLTDPQGDITLESGIWITVRSRDGVYRQTENALDLSDNVTLYRDDGTMMHTASAAVDLKHGATAGSEPVHAEGPFGVLDAQGGFTVTDKGENVQFAGPAHLILNGANAQ